MPTANPIAQAHRHVLLFADVLEPQAEPKAGDAPPTSHSTKAEIVAWLDARGVDEALDSGLTKADLLAMVDQEK